MELLGALSFGQILIFAFKFIPAMILAFITWIIICCAVVLLFVAIGAGLAIVFGK